MIPSNRGVEVEIPENRREADEIYRTTEGQGIELQGHRGMRRPDNRIGVEI